jgi:hypothetical protein
MIFPPFSKDWRLISNLLILKFCFKISLNSVMGMGRSFNAKSAPIMIMFPRIGDPIPSAKSVSDSGTQGSEVDTVEPVIVTGQHFAQIFISSSLLSTGLMTRLYPFL